MKSTSSFIFAALLGLASISAARAQLEFDFAANTGSAIQFNGSAHSFQFTPGTVGSQWHVTDESGGTGDALGLDGSITGGPFNYGTVTTSGPVQSADITGPDGTLTINDGNGFSLSGSIDLMTVDTAFNTGILNGDLTIDLTDLTYGGSNSDLKALVAEQPGTVILSFQFATSENLSSLSEGSSPSGHTSYSGSVEEAPEPSTYALMLGGFALLGFCVRRKLA